MPPTHKTGLVIPTLLRFTATAYPQRRDRQVVRKALTNPLFPRTFFIRNILALEQEPAWQRYPLRLKRARLLQILLQRSRFFLTVKQWVQKQGLPVPATTADCAAVKAAQTDDYCNHCGECCEIASGLPQFPAPDQLPPDWQRTFAAGLGRHHRFCGFLWEAAGSARSVCAIHPWRPIPCRLFAREECDYLRQHPGPVAEGNDAALLSPLCGYGRQRGR